MRILDLGLKFAPEKSLHKFKVFIDLQKHLRKLDIKKHFALNKDTRVIEDPEFVQTNLKINSVFNPKTPGNQ